MGVLSDKLMVLIDKLEQSDRKTKQLTDDYIHSTHQMLDEMNNNSSDDCLDEEIRDSIEFLQSQGYTVTKN